MSRPEKRFALLVLPLLLAVGWACVAGREARSSAVSEVESESVTPGEWGGEHVRMQVTENGATVEFDCAHGTIDHKLTTEESGQFRAKGTYVREHGGPEREGEEEEGRKGVPATYSGRTDGKTMTLTVRLAGSNERIGPFTLGHGRKVRLTKCM